MQQQVRVEKFEKAGKLDAITFAVIKSRIDGIIDETTDILLQASRSPILYAAKDLTTALFSWDAKLLTMANSIPLHICGLRNCLQFVVEAFKDDIHPGDAFVNNSPYHGANHYGDWSMTSPVFHDGELVAWVGSICHIIDTGAYIPTNLDPLGKDVYEEGLHFPGVRFVKEYKENDDIIRFCEANIRYPHQWHGDFLAQLGALYRGAEEIMKLCKKYGADVIKQFQEELINYADRRMTEEIKKLPKGTWSISDIGEAIGDLAPEGVRLAAKLTIDPGEAMITFDLTDMDDQRDWGYNCTKSTAEGACLVASLASVDPSLPRNEGVCKHFRYILREGAVCGLPKWPVGTSLGTIGLNSQIVGMILRLWEKAVPGKGHAAGGEINASCSVCSGVDVRRNNDPYGHMFFTSMSGGPGSKGYDGWPSWLHDGAMGNQIAESIELTEITTPITIWELGVYQDSGGPGQWRGAVGHTQSIQPKEHTMKLITCAGGHTHAPKGASGGWPGALADHWTNDPDTAKIKKKLKNLEYTEIKEDEIWFSLCNGGGGYGDPLDRDPEAVKYDVRNGFISFEAAREIYGVILHDDSELLTLDEKATEALRIRLKKERKGKTPEIYVPPSRQDFYPGS